MSTAYSEDQDSHPIESEKASTFFLLWGRFVTRQRWLCLSLTILLTIGSAWIAAERTTIDMGIEAFTDHKSKNHEILQEFRDVFGRDDVWMIAVEGDVFSQAYLKKLTTLHHQISAINLEIKSLSASNPNHKKSVPTVIPDIDDFMEDDEGWGDEAAGGLFEDVLSLINTKETRAVTDGIEVADLFPSIPSVDDIKKIKKRVLQDPSIVKQMVNKKGTLSIMIIRSQFMNDADSIVVTAELRSIAKAMQGTDFKIHIAGIPTLNSDLTELSTNNMQRLFMAAMILMILILFYLFRHPVAVFGPIMVVMISSINTFGFMALVGIPITMLSMILPAFVVCVGLGDSVHLISIFRDNILHKSSHRDALIQAIGNTAKPIVYTSLTTMIGLFSFRFASLEGIQQMGTAGAIGVLGACLHSLVFLPACLSFVKTSTLNVRQLHTETIHDPKVSVNINHTVDLNTNEDEENVTPSRPHNSADRLDRFLQWCNACSGVPYDTGTGHASGIAKTRRTRTLIVGLGLIIILLIAISHLRIYHNPMSWLHETHPLRVSFDLIDEKMGGSADIHLLIDGSEERGLKDVELLESLEKLDAYMQSFQHPQHGAIVGPVLSPLNVIKSTHRALYGGAQEQYKLPKTHREVADHLFLFENAGPEQLKRLLTNDLKRGRVTYRLKWIEANGYQPVADYLNEGIERFIPKNVKVQATGTAYSLLSTIGRLIIDLVTSFGFAFAIITLLLIIQLQSIKLGLIAMIPNLAPILFVMGFMAMTNVPIDMVNLLIASIAIGIAVDDTIHFLHHFRIHFDQYGNVEQAIANSFSHAGRAMVSTSAILGIGFFAFSFANILSIQRFGVLISLTTVVAMLVDLIFTPALLRAFYDRKAS